MKTYILYKTLYFLAVLGQTPEVRDIIKADTVFQRFARSATEKLHTLPTRCKEDIDCYLSGWCWSEADNRAIRQELARLSGQGAFRQMIHKQLRRCGKFRLYDSLDDAAYLQRLWQDAADGMNYCFHAYMKNERLLYPGI